MKWNLTRLTSVKIERINRSISMEELEKVIKAIFT